MPEPLPTKYAFVRTKSLRHGIQAAAALVVSRASEAGFNPRQGVITIKFTDDEVSAKWEPLP